MRYTISELSDFEELMPGKYVLYKSNHFVGLREPSSARLPVRKNSELDLAKYDMILQVQQQGCKTSMERDVSGGSPSLTDQQKRKIDDSKLEAVARKGRRLAALRGLRLHHADPDSTWIPAIPASPEEFDLSTTPDVDILKLVHPHRRDLKVQFHSASHVYEVHGQATNGSVTGMIHAFCRKFDADTTIQGMQNGPRWPREGYLREQVSMHSLVRLSTLCPELPGLFVSRPRNDAQIAGLLQRLRHVGDFEEEIVQLSLSSPEIRDMWSRGCSEAAHYGTYMHYLFEAYLNGYEVPRSSPEFRMFQSFLSSIDPLATVWRTEWVVYGEDENIAGSIDFCAKLADGSLMLADWKRTSGLRNKFGSRQQMLPPLQHLPDCTGMHYRLQLNAYRYIVGRFEAETEAMMAIWRDARGGADASSPPFPGRLETRLEVWEGTQRQHETMSADGIAGRRPYGMQTRMIELVGWKRYELNCLLKFQRVCEQNQAMMAIWRDARGGADASSPPFPGRLETRLEVWEGTQRQRASFFGEFPNSIRILPRPSDCQIDSKRVWEKKMYISRNLLAMLVDDYHNKGYIVYLYICNLLRHHPAQRRMFETAIPHPATASMESRMWLGAVIDFLVTHFPPRLYVSVRCKKDVRGGSQESIMPPVGVNPETDAVMQQPDVDGQPERLMGLSQELEGFIDEAQHSEHLERARKRRTLPGAATTTKNFELDLGRYNAACDISLDGAVQFSESGEATILQRVEGLKRWVLQRMPNLDDDMLRLAVGAVSVYRLRLWGMHIREHVLLLWIVEGGEHMRCHGGNLYFYQHGAFTVHRGIPPQATLARCKKFVLVLEGFFRSITRSRLDNDQQVLDELSTLLSQRNNSRELMQDCETAALRGSGKRLPHRRARSAAPVGDGEEAQDAPAAADESGSNALADALSKIGLAMQRQLLEDRIFNLVVEWCDTPQVRAAGCSYQDCAVMYDLKSDQPVTMVGDSPNNNLYLHIAHPLMQRGLPDPVLKQAEERLLKFYAQTFWLNNEVFACNQAAIALAKRGENIVRCFIGESPGGVGQSLYSAHLDAVYSPNHKFIDPNIWYDESEMRKQVEQSAGCFILTAQEAPETNKKMREDLFKKTMSADGIAGRRPYGMQTRMIELVGWKRYELNRLLKFQGVCEQNLPSVLRRGLVWKPMARFIEESVIFEVYPDANLDGYFSKDDTLKDFLRSGPAVAAALRIQHGFETLHTRQHCVDKIENYANQPFTEDRIRSACGLPKKVRSGESAAQLRLPVDPSSQEDEDDNKKSEVDSFSPIGELIKSHCLQSGKTVMTKTMFVGYLRMPAGHPKELSKDAIWQKLLEHRLLLPAKDTAKYKDSAIPFIACTKSLGGIVSVDVAEDTTEHREVHDVSALLKYAHGCEDREANAALVIAYLDSQINSGKGVGKGNKLPEALEKLKSLRSKLSIAEELLSCTCEKASSSWARESKSSRPDVQRLKRRRTHKQADDTAEPEAVEIEPAELPEPDTFVQERAFVYERNFQNMIRTRAYVKGDGAQKFSRRMLRVLCPQTVDFDIQNAVFVILQQLVQKLDVSSSMPQALLDILADCAAKRKEICENKLNLSEKKGKHLLHELLFGGIPPASLAQNHFVKDFQQLSLCLRWLACSLLPETYAVVKDMSAKKHPEASALFYLYAAVEDYILQAWEVAVMRLKPKHLSLHFDGLRCMGMETEMTTGQLCTHFAEHIKAATGFDVVIVEKEHLLFSEMCFGTEEKIDKLDFDSAMKAPGNCICLALANLFPNRLEQIKKWVKGATSENADAERTCSRSYKKTLHGLKVHAVPSMDPVFQVGGKYLIHAENGGRPHCISCVVRAEDDVVLVDSRGRTYSTVSQVTGFAETCLDSKSIVLFRCFEKQPGPIPPAQALKEGQEILLNLQAGAGQDEWASCLTQPADSSLQESSDDEGGDPEAELDESLVQVSNTLLRSMELEVSRQLETTSNTKKCPFCPFRTFQKNSRAQSHVRRYHTEGRQFVCSGTKQLKIVAALFDDDQISGSPGGKYLERSACILRQSIVPGLSVSQNEIDRYIRLVLTADGPLLCNLSALGDTMHVRRARNLYYDQGFAELVFREMLMCSGKCQAAKARILTFLAGRKAQLLSLLPTMAAHWWPLIEDVFAAPVLQACSKKMVDFFIDRREFETISIDATIKCCMAVMGQESYRRSATKRNAAPFDDESAYRRVLTVRGRTSAVLAMVAVPNEKAEEVRQIQCVAADNASLKLYAELARILPNLQALCLDPIHLAIVYEYATWRKKTQGARFLRKILQKFISVDPKAAEGSFAIFFHGHEERNLSLQEIRVRDQISNGSMLPAKAKRIYATLDGEKPFRSRLEYVEALAALAALHPEDMARKVTGANQYVSHVLWCSSSPMRLEWLWNNLRASDLTLLPAGTSSNEALHAEIKNWFSRIQQIHQSTLQLKLSILTLSKQWPHFTALRNPTLSQMSGQSLLARLAGKSLWTSDSWREWCMANVEEDVVCKADIPLEESRRVERRLVRQWSVKRPAACQRSAQPKRKRTVFTMERDHKLRRQGTKRS
ncbi:unnamed protein product [Symbiodinium sp. CCMP2592]|nr:unnamed protein product [Symbiodinium sp. CCMP2592]